MIRAHSAGHGPEVERPPFTPISAPDNTRVIYILELSVSMDYPADPRR